MKPAVFFDRDNTLIVNDGYLSNPDEVTLLPGAADAIVRARRMGFAIVTVSNQSGVARGMMSEDDVRAVDRRMDELLLQQHEEARIDLHEFCPFHPEASVEAYRRNSPRRKPEPGMLLDAAESLGLDLKRSWVVGDSPRDIEAGKRAGCRTVLLRDKSIENHSPAADERLGEPPDYFAESLQDAIDFIAMNHVNRPTQLPTPTPVTTSSIDLQLDRIVNEIRQLGEERQEFSIARLAAGITLGLSLAAGVAALIFRDQPETCQTLLLTAILLQTVTTSLVLMSR